MFDTWQGMGCDWPPPVTAPPEEVIDCLVEDQPGVGEPVRWSDYVPDGLADTGAAACRDSPRGAHVLSAQG